MAVSTSSFINAIAPRILEGTQPSPTTQFASQSEFYEAIAKQVESVWATLNQTGTKDLANKIETEVRKITAKYLVPTETPLGMAYRIKPESYQLVIKEINALVNYLLLKEVLVLLMQKAGELRKTAEGYKSSNPPGLPTPIIPLLPTAPQQNRMYVQVETERK